MPPNLQTHPTYTERAERQPPNKHQHGVGLFLLGLLLVALIGVTIEYFGVTNFVRGFGRKGKPAIELGIWQPKSFTDISEDFWAHSSVQALAEQGVVMGYPNDEYRATQPITRAEFAAMLQSAFVQTPEPRFIRSLEVFFNPDSTALTGGFNDVSPELWAAPAIADVTNAEFLGGFPNNEFRPEQAISRANALVAIANALGVDPGAANRDYLWVYRDAPEIPEYAKDRIAVVTEAGIRLLQADSPLLRPNQTLTRAEAAVLLNQALGVVKQ